MSLCLEKFYREYSLLCGDAEDGGALNYGDDFRGVSVAVSALSQNHQGRVVSGVPLQCGGANPCRTPRLKGQGTSEDSCGLDF